MSRLIDGVAIAQTLCQEVAEQTQVLLASHGVKPGLAVVIVGDNPASRVYVNRKKKACLDAGFNSWEYALDQSVSQQELLALIDSLNRNPEVHGILVQLPLPAHICEDDVILAIHPKKDVDGFHPINVGQMVIGQPSFLPCTPAGVQQLLIRENVETAGKHVVIVGRSNIVGKPMAMIMIQRGLGADSTVTICHSKSQNLADLTRQADILIAAVGRPLFITKDMIKPGAVVIDVGINRVDDPSSERGYRLVGDVDFDQAKLVASAITPVPGGVGPMTIAMLLANTLQSAKTFLENKIHG